MDYKIIENELIPIYEGNKKERVVNARKLHIKLESKQKFSDWIKNRIEKYEFVENTDFFKRHNFMMVGNLRRPQIDYCLASDIAEQLQLYSESGLPHSNLIGVIARQLGYKTS